MANLTRAWTWEKWVPPLGDNPGDKPFFLEIASGLTKEELSVGGSDFQKALEPPEPVEGVDPWHAWGEKMAVVFGKHVRLGTESLRIVDGTGAVLFEVKTLADFFELCLKGPKSIVWEVSRAVFFYNSIGGQLELFSERHSGGTGSTPAPSAVKDEGQTGGP